MSESLMSSPEHSEHTEATPEIDESWLTSLRAWFRQLIAGRDATQIAAQTTVPPERQCSIITNKTAHRIAIKPDQPDSPLPALIIAPFGSRDLPLEDSQPYAASLDAWVLRDLVELPPRIQRGHAMRHSSSFGRMIALLVGACCPVAMSCSDVKLPWTMKAL